MTIQWYPGHIAKAERELKDQLKRVDVVLDVRDARIPLTTHHPQLHAWIGSKARVLIINRMDAIPPAVQRLWEEWFQAQGEVPYFTNAQQGRGIREAIEAAQKAGVAMNQRRRARGMRPRPVRAVVVGFPNVGKSALINRLLGRRVVESARRAGVTRRLRWVRISDQIELLDAPGVIPAKLDDQQDAFKLAICDDIGEASYDNQRIAATFVELFKDLERTTTSELFPRSVLVERYALDPTPLTGEDYLHTLADLRHTGDVERTARELLTDFRKGMLGAIPLEFPPNC
jgi:ribosome biogenesis GTPase A